MHINLSPFYIINTIPRKTRILLHADCAESTELHWVIRDSYWLIFNRSTQTGLDDSIAHHPWRHVFATSVAGISVKPQSKSPCAFEYYLWKSIQSVLSVVKIVIVIVIVFVILSLTLNSLRSLFVTKFATTPAQAWIGMGIKSLRSLRPLRENINHPAIVTFQPKVNESGQKSQPFQ